MGMQTIIVEPGFTTEVSLNITSTVAGKPVQQGIQTATVTDVLLGSTVGSISDTSSITLEEGEYTITWSDKPCYQYEVLSKDVTSSSPAEVEIVSKLEDLIAAVNQNADDNEAALAQATLDIVAAVDQARDVISQDIQTNTTEITGKLDTVITELQTGNLTLNEVKTILEEQLLEVKAINENTDQVEGLLQTVIDTIEALDPTDDDYQTSFLNWTLSGYSDGVPVYVANRLDSKIDPDGTLVDTFTTYYKVGDGGIPSTSKPSPLTLKTNSQVVVLPDVCADVDGRKMYVRPAFYFDGMTNTQSDTFYLDKTGAVVAGTVTVGSACDCDCIECETIPAVGGSGDDLVDQGYMRISMDTAPNLPFSASLKSYEIDYETFETNVVEAGDTEFFMYDPLDVEYKGSPQSFTTDENAGGYRVYFQTPTPHEFLSFKGQAILSIDNFIDGTLVGTTVDSLQISIQDTQITTFNPETVYHDWTVQDAYEGRDYGFVNWNLSDNAIDSIDFSNVDWSTQSGETFLHDNNLGDGLIIPANTRLYRGDFRNNNLTSAKVDELLINLSQVLPMDAYSSPWTTQRYDFRGQTPPAPPTAASQAARDLIIANGGEIFTD